VICETVENGKWKMESIHDAEAIENGINMVDEEKTLQNRENLSIIAYCVFSLHDIAYQEVNF
jgi:hypothetical protein